MTDFLLFTIYAPLASWGSIAVGELRDSWDRPSRSAILGLIGAAKGLARDDADAHQALDAGYGIAVRVDAVGSVHEDYHTTQTVAAKDVKRGSPGTRRELLRAGELLTILSKRTLRQDAVSTIALWALPDARWPLENLMEALRSPTYTLYAGRKANVLGLPLNPSLVRSLSLAAALATRKDPADLGVDDRSPISWVPATQREVAFDAPPFDVTTGLAIRRTEVRRDTGAHRQRWQFGNRRVLIGVASIPEPSDPKGDAND